MNLCTLCEQAGADPEFGRYDAEPGAGRYRLCCMARALSATEPRFYRQAADAMTAHLSPLDAHAVRVRAHELIHARRQREAEL